MNISNNRKFLNEYLIWHFVSKLAEKSTVVDIGKSFKWADLYTKIFKDFHYLTMDRNNTINPDLLVDLEDTDVIKSSYSNFADAILCNGVTEQCDNPFILIENINTLTKEGGLLLFGIASIGNKVYEKDYCRFTQAGAEKLISKFFKIEEIFPIITDNTLEYIFLICKKTKP